MKSFRCHLLSVAFLSSVLLTACSSGGGSSNSSPDDLWDDKGKEDDEVNDNNITLAKSVEKKYPAESKLEKAIMMNEENHTTTAALVKSNESSNIGTAHFFLSTMRRHPSTPIQTATANAAVAQLGTLLIKSTCSGGRADIIASFFVACI